MKAPAIAGVMWGLLALGLAEGQESSLSDLNLENTEAKLTLATVSEENADLKRQLRLAQDQVKSLTESLAIATNEAEVFRREAGELKLRMEALGIDATASDKGKLEQRLLKAVSDLQILRDEKEKLSNQLILLSESVLQVVKGAENIDPEARLSIETQLRATNEVLGVSGSETPTAEAVPATVTDAIVLSVKEELALVVANVGRLHGVQTGMPFEVLKGGEPVATLRVVDVREKISGAVIQEIKSDSVIKVGDRLRVAAKQ